MADWHITVRVSPHSTGNGSDKDMAAVGGPKQGMLLSGEKFDQVYSQAKMFMEGIRTNPMVWMVELEEVRKV